ncbi:MAG: GtrA family protein [Candidatus Baltobacteraceae bacterium]
MHSVVRRRGVRQFAKFGVVGFSGLVVNFLASHLLQKNWPQFPWSGDFAIGFMAGAVSNWYLNRVWTFRSSAQAGREAFQFLTVSALSLGVGQLVFWWRPFGNHFSYTWAAATAAGIFVNFFLNKYWTFKDAV